MAVSGAGPAQNDKRGLLKPVMSEKCGCVGIRLVYGLFYTVATPDWSHKLTERRENWPTNGTVEGHSVRSNLLTKSSCCLKLR